MLRGVSWICPGSPPTVSMATIGTGGVLPRPTPFKTAFLQYTSGSTSVPKGVMLSHRNLLANAALIQQAFGNTTSATAVFWLPSYHDMGLIGGVLQPIYCGGSCTLLAPAAFLQRPALWLETISQTRATVERRSGLRFRIRAPGSVRAEDRQGLDLSGWKIAFVGAERIRVQTLERVTEAFAPCGFRRESFFPCYGVERRRRSWSGWTAAVAPGRTSRRCLRFGPARHTGGAEGRPGVAEPCRMRRDAVRSVAVDR